MNAIRAWFWMIVALVALTLVLHHLGMDLPAALASMLQGTERFLGRPLVTL